MMRKRIYILLVLQLLVLGGLYGYHQSALHGPAYRIEAKPVDPRDLFRGDYVILGYEISEPDEALIKPLNLRWREDVYVVLEENTENGFWEVVAVHKQAPEVAEDQLLLQAEWRNRRIDYGIRRYYVPEGRGNPEGKITVDIVLNRQGRAMIKQLYSDGEAWY